MRLLGLVVFVALLTACSPNGEAGNSTSADETTEATSDKASTVSNTGLPPEFSLASMNELNECVSGEATKLVTDAKGNIDDVSKSSIAASAVKNCDPLIDPAAQEHVVNLKATVAMPATDAASIKVVTQIKKALESRSAADWRKFHVDTKIGFAKNYVDIVADRFKNQPQQQDKSGSAIAQN